MRFLLFIIFVSTFIACNKSKNNLVIEDLKYSAYFMHFNEKVDSFEFYLVHYLEIDKKGKFILMRHNDWRDSPKYFKGVINDTVRQYIDTTFYYETFETDYSYDVNTNGIYDGYTYCLDYQKENNFKKKIQFIPINSPNKIRSLMTSLEELIYNIAKSPGDTLDIKDYTEQLERLYIDKNGRIPKPIKSPTNTGTKIF